MLQVEILSSMWLFCSHVWLAQDFIFQEESKFRYSMSELAIYAITDKGSRLASWPGDNPSSLPPLASKCTGILLRFPPAESNLYSQAQWRQ